MSKKLLQLSVTAAHGRSFSFEFYGDPKYLPDWEAAGLVVEEVVSTIPEVIAGSWLRWPWVWCQAIFNFRLPWGL